MASGKIDRSLMLKELKQAFPEIAPLINQEQGLLHFEVGAFYQFTQKHIDRGDIDTVKQCFTAAKKYFLSGDNKVKNAIAVSYAECLEFNNTKTDNRYWAWGIYPDELKQEYLLIRCEPKKK